MRVRAVEEVMTSRKLNAVKFSNNNDKILRHDIAIGSSLPMANSPGADFDDVSFE